MNTVSNVISLMLLSLSCLYGQAPNNNCENASTLVISDEDNKLSILVDFEVSTPSYLQSGDCGNSSDKDLWYSFVAPSDNIQFEYSNGTSINSHPILLYSGSCDNLQYIGCAYESTTTAGDTYYIRIKQSSTYEQLSLSLYYSTLISEDECINATPVTVGQTLLEAEKIIYNRRNISYSGIADCYEQEYRDAWYTFIAPSTGAIRIYQTGSTSTNAYSIYSGSCSSSSVIACNIDNNYPYIYDLIPGEEYIIQGKVLGNDNYYYHFPANGFQLVEVPEESPNDDCNSATEIIVSSSYPCTSTDSVSMLGSTLSNLNSNCYDLEGKTDVWYYFTAPSSGSVDFHLDISNVEKSIYTGDCNTLQLYTCINGSNLNGLTPGEIYYVQIFNEPTNSILDACIVQQSNSALDNDICENSITLTPGESKSLAMHNSNIDSEIDASCEIRPHDIWYNFTTPSTGFSMIKQEGINKFVIYEGDCTSLSEVLCSEENNQEYQTLLDLNTNQSYYMRVYNPSNQYQDYYNNSIEYYESTLEENDVCGSAQSIVTDPNGTTNIGIGTSGIDIDFSKSSLSDIELPSEIAYEYPKDLWYNINTEENTALYISKRLTSYYYHPLTEFTVVLYKSECDNLNIEYISLPLKSDDQYIFNNLEQNTDYKIRIISGENLLGKFYLDWVETNSQDECIDAIEIQVSENICSYAIPIDLSNSTESIETSSCSTNSQQDVWRYFSPPTSGSITFENVKSESCSISIYSGECGNLVEVECFNINNDTQDVDNLFAGETYYMKIIGAEPAICIYTTPIPSEESQCANAVNLNISDDTCNETILGSTQNASNSFGYFCGNDRAKAVYYTISPNEEGYHTITISNSAVNHNIAIFQNCVLGPPLACGTTEISYNLMANTEYIVAVYAVVQSQSSSFDICIHTSDADESSNVGISLTSPQVKLDVNGGIKPGYSENEIAGNIRWSGQLEGYDGNNWKNLIGWDHKATKLIDMNSKRIRELATPQNNFDAATKKYVDEHEDGDSDSTNEIETWSTLEGIPIDFADGVDDVNDADNDPNNEIETWFTLEGIPADFLDGKDDVNDDDNDPANEAITEIVLDGTEIIITEGGTDHFVDIDAFSKVFERSGSTIKNVNSINDDFLFGANSIPLTGNTTQSFMMFDESKAAFRVGQVANSGNWNEGNLGLYSFGTGYNTLASGFYSASFNKDTKAESSYSTAIGRYNEGGGSQSVWSSNDPLFEIGIGSAAIPKNAMTVLKNGRVGIGNSSPDALLSLSSNGSGTTPQLTLTEDGVGDGSRITFKNSNTASNKWTLFGSPDDASDASEFNLHHTSTGNIITARGNGDVGIGGVPDMDFHLHHGNSGTSSGMKLENTDNGKWIRMYVSSGSGDLRFYSEDQGSTIIGAIDDVTGTYTALSDRRVKKDLTELHFDWSSFMKLKPLTYKFIKDKNGKKAIGLIAQEVNDIYPELITYHEDNDLYHMDYSGVGVVAVKAVQELKKENEELKKQLEALLTRLEKLENK